MLVAAENKDALGRQSTIISWRNWAGDAYLRYPVLRKSKILLEAGKAR